MKKNFLFKAFGVLTLALLVLNSCKKDEPTAADPIVTPNNYTPPAVTFSAPIQGFVVDEGGNAVNGAEVKTGTKTTITDKNGYFKIDAAPFTGDFCYIKAVKKGFFTGSTTIHGQAGSDYAAELVMVSQNNVISFPAAQGKNISLQGGAEVNLPANSFITSTGKSYTGNVNVAIMHIDPAAKKFSSLIPGGDLRAFDANGQNVQLYSYGMLNVEMRDDAGNLLQLASGTKSILTIPVPASTVATAPSTIPLWYFDEDKGIWIEEGSATLQGTKYVGTVSHFTPWNIDKPYPPAIVEGKVVDSDGNPMGGVTIKIGQIRILSSNDGTFRIYTSSDEDIIVDALDWETGNSMGINKSVHTPALGQTLNIGDITLPTQSKIKIKANVVDCNNNPLTGFAIIKKGNFTGRSFVKNSVFKYYLNPTGGEAEITFCSNDVMYSTTSKVTVPTNTSVPVIDLGTVKVCSPPSNVDYIKFTYTLPGQAPVDVVKIATKTAEGYRTQNSQGVGTVIDFIDVWDNNNGSNNTFGIWLRVKTDKPGQYLLNLGNGDGIIGYVDMPSRFQIHSDSTVLNITKYDNVGGTIEGNFSGTARIANNLDNDYELQSLGVITNGEFKVKRVADR